jgi:hypothetical protein
MKIFREKNLPSTFAVLAAWRLCANLARQAAKTAKVE